MNTLCKYVLGEFSAEEFSAEEFFIGYKDCSTNSTGINCNNLFLYPKPYTNTQWELDYNLLFNYVLNDLLVNSSIIINKTQIGLIPDLELDFGKQTKYLIDLLLLFKDQLKLNPTIDNYIVLFNLYSISCINKHFTSIFNKPKYIKQMLGLLNILSIIGLDTSIKYQYNNSLNLDPIYYIANI